MKRGIVLLMLVLLPMVVAEPSEHNSILPTSSLWSFDLFFEKVVIFFTPSDARAGLYLASAQERTSELQEMGIDVTDDIFIEVESEWQQNINYLENLGVDVSFEKKSHLDVLKEIQEKVPQAVSDEIQKSTLPYVDLTL